MTSAFAPIRVLDPVGAGEVRQEALPAVVRRAPQPRLEGAVLGVITNAFRGYDVPGAVADRIAQQAGLAAVVRNVKPSLSRPAGAAVYADLASKVDAVIVGLCA